MGIAIDQNLEIAACFGSDATVSALRWQMAVPIKKDITAIRDARANGVDIKSITLPTLGGKDIATWFGSDATAGGIKFQYFTKIKKDI
ncbi:hypothetical protein VTL71DRAFT_5788 [Oculimacula yallundae]|uniref:Uncharacterized protein n=1 Tax=Oculimacula yallundae TaxID=86028 RepID=A0ABR4C007_9HELO